MTVSRPSDMPTHLIDAEIERELLSGALLAAVRLEDAPGDAGALAALALVRATEEGWFALRVHREVLAAMRSVLDAAGTLTPALLAGELRARGQLDALRLLPSLPYGLAPVRSIGVHAERLRRLARERRRWRRAQAVQAEIVQRGATS